MEYDNVNNNSSFGLIGHQVQGQNSEWQWNISSLVIWHENNRHDVLISIDSDTSVWCSLTI